MHNPGSGRATKLWIAGIGATALIVGPMTGVATAAPATIYVYNGMTPSSDADCLAALVTHQTIQSAVTDANDGDTIVVCPGTYPETASDTGKVLTFESQTPLGATVNGGGGSAFTLSGVGSSLDGFKLTGATTATDTPAAFLKGNNEKITGSTFDGDSNAATLYADNHVTLTGNTVQNPNQAFNSTSGAAGFFFAAGGGDDSTVSGNTFIGDFEDAAVNIADEGVDANNLTIEDNSADTSAGGNFVVAGGTTGLSVLDNTVTGGADSGTGILLLGEDSGYSITGNMISGRSGASGVSISSYSADIPVNGGGDVSMNSFKGNLRGINVYSASGTITAHLNVFVGNSEAAIKNTTNAVVTATNNFYGCNGGPGATGCDAIEGNVNATPYLVLSTSVAHSSIPQGGTTTFTADLNHNNAGNTVGSALGDHVLNGVESAAFTFSGGSASPTPVPILGGSATTVLTAGSTPGTYPATAKVENATSSTPVTITGGSGGGKPSIRIIDTNTVEGNSGTHPMRFPVRLSKKATVAVTLHYQTADGSAKAGSDYIAKSGTLTIARGAKSGVITVLVKGDKVPEPSETFFVTLSNATNAFIADPNASGVIKNDD